MAEEIIPADMVVGEVDEVIPADQVVGEVDDHECASCKAGGACTGCAEKPAPAGIAAPAPEPEKPFAVPDAGDLARSTAGIYTDSPMIKELAAFVTQGPAGYIGKRLAEDPKGNALAAVQGASLRLADEIEGGGVAAAQKVGGNELPLDTLYRAAQQKSLGRYNEAAQNSPRLFGDDVEAIEGPFGFSTNPSTYSMSETAGGMAIPGSKLAQYAGGSKTVLGTAARTSAVGAGYGAVSGLGGSDANVLQGGEYGKAAWDSAMGALQGGATGALIGGAARGRSNSLARKADKATEFAGKATAAEENITARKELPKKQARENEAAAQTNKEASAKYSVDKLVARAEEEAANARVKADYDTRVAEIKANNKAGSQKYKQEMTKAKTEANAANSRIKADVAAQRAQAKADAAAETARLEAEALEESKRAVPDQALVYAGVEGDVSKMGGIRRADAKAQAIFPKLDELNKLPVDERGVTTKKMVDESGAEFGESLKMADESGATVPRAPLLAELKKGPGGLMSIEERDALAQVIEYVEGRPGIRRGTVVEDAFFPTEAKVLRDDIGKSKGGRIPAFAGKVIERHMDAGVKPKLGDEGFALYKERATKYGQAKDLDRGSQNLLEKYKTSKDANKRSPIARDVIGVKPRDVERVQPRDIPDPQEVTPRAVEPFEAAPVPRKPAAVQRREVAKPVEVSPKQLEAPEFPGGEEALAQIVEDLNQLGPSKTRHKLAQILSDVGSTGAVDVAGGGAGYAKIGARGLGRLLLGMGPPPRGPLTLGAKVKEAQSRATKATDKSKRKGADLEKIIRENPRVARAILQWLRQNAEAEQTAP